jgi:hypothetical protein
MEEKKRQGPQKSGSGSGMLFLGLAAVGIGAYYLMKKKEPNSELYAEWLAAIGACTTLSELTEVLAGIEADLTAGKITQAERDLLYAAYQKKLIEFQPTDLPKGSFVGSLVVTPADHTALIGEEVEVQFTFKNTGAGGQLFAFLTGSMGKIGGVVPFDMKTGQVKTMGLSFPMPDLPSISGQAVIGHMFNGSLISDATLSFSMTQEVVIGKVTFTGTVRDIFGNVLGAYFDDLGNLFAATIWTGEGTGIQSCSVDSSGKYTLVNGGIRNSSNLIHCWLVGYGQVDTTISVGDAATASVDFELTPDTPIAVDLAVWAVDSVSNANLIGAAVTVLDYLTGVYLQTGVTGADGKISWSGLCQPGQRIEVNVLADGYNPMVTNFVVPTVPSFEYKAMMVETFTPPGKANVHIHCYSAIFGVPLSQIFIYVAFDWVANTDANGYALLSAVGDVGTSILVGVAYPDMTGQSQVINLNSSDVDVYFYLE